LLIKQHMKGLAQASYECFSLGNI
ncbi:unnamed protein product, partial [Rotaria sp. Silwood1]